MTDDARLTDFGGGDDGGGEASEASDDDGAEEAATGNDERGASSAAADDATPDDATAPGPAADAAGIDTTYQWDPEGRPCAACGAVVERRWRDEDGLVCPDCKDW